MQRTVSINYFSIVSDTPTCHQYFTDTLPSISGHIDRYVEQFIDRYNGQPMLFQWIAISVEYQLFLLECLNQYIG